jgi:WD40 repeat protein
MADGTIRVHDLITSEERVLRLERERALPPREGQADPPLDLLPRAIECLAFSPDGSILAAGTDVKVRGDFSIATIHLWDVARGRELRRIHAHQQWVHSLCFSPDGKTLASTGVGPVIGLWDVATGREAFPQSGHQSYVRDLVVSPADGTVFTGGYDGTIRRWDPRSGKQLEITARFTTPADVLAISPDGECLLIGGSQGGRFVLWSAAERREIRRFPRLVERNPVRHVVFSPDGKTVASERRIWDAGSGRVLVTFRDRDEQNNHSANFFSIVYSPDGKEVITAENEGIRIWDIASGKEARWAVRAKIRSEPVALSPDGRLMATGGVIARFQGGEVDPPIRVWELASGQEIATLEGHEESTRGLAFSPDDRILVSSSGTYHSENDATVRAWDVASGRELRRFDGHRGAVWAVAFTPDGRSVVSASEDGTALVWDVSDLRAHQMAAEPLTAEQIRARWDELASDDAHVAYRASWALSVPSAVSFLRDRLSAAPSPTHKRTSITEGPVGPPELLRTLRAIASLERVGTPEAREAIETLAHGDPAALETREATSTLARLKNRQN